MAKKKPSTRVRQRTSPTLAASTGNSARQTAYSPVTRNLAGPVFAQASPTPDPGTFRVPHPSDGQAYKQIDELVKEHKVFPLQFDPPRGMPEPVLTLAQVLGGISSAPPAVAKTAANTVSKIEASGQIVFHAHGDCGSTNSAAPQNLVVDKMLGDFDESDSTEVPSFQLMLGDVVYSFGEAKYYFDQFYDPYRDYPAPILAAAGNHDGMVSPLAGAKSLEAYLRNFCQQDFVVTPEALGLSRTAQIQPGVFFTLEATKLLRILVLYSNTLEDPGVIADGVVAGSAIGNSQLDYLKNALTRIEQSGYSGALLIADHHPPYTFGRHGWSQGMLDQIDTICDQVGVWPHAFLSGHAHNYQRFTRTRNKDGTQIPYVVCGNGGHSPLQLLSKTAGQTLRAPQVVQQKSAKTDLVTFESYDDQNYGYLRVIVTNAQLRIEYHPASDGRSTKSPDDAVTVDLKTRKLVHYNAKDLGHAAKAQRVRAASSAQSPRTARTSGRRAAKLQR